MPVLKFDELPQFPNLASAGFHSCDSSGTLIAGAFRLSHTFAVGGQINVPSGSTNYIPPWFVELASGQTASIVKIRSVIQAGTSATFGVFKNGVALTGASAIVATTTAANTTPTATAVVTDDAISIVVSAISAAPYNLTVSIAVDYLR